MAQEQDPDCSLFCGDLPRNAGEEFVRELFAAVGYELKSVYLIYQKGTKESAGYCFVEFKTPELAAKVLGELEGKEFPTDKKRRFKLGRPTKTPLKSTEYSAFVGELPDEVTEDEMKAFFLSRYPSVLAAKIVTNQAGKSRNYGFVRFSSAEECARCIREMNGVEGLGSEALRVSQASPRKTDIARQMAAHMHAAQWMFAPGMAIPTQMVVPPMYIPNMPYPDMQKGGARAPMAPANQMMPSVTYYGNPGQAGFGEPYYPPMAYMPPNMVPMSYPQNPQTFQNFVMMQPPNMGPATGGRYPIGPGPMAANNPPFEQRGKGRNRDVGAQIPHAKNPNSQNFNSIPAPAASAMPAIPGNFPKNTGDPNFHMMRPSNAMGEGQKFVPVPQPVYMDPPANDAIPWVGSQTGSRAFPG